MAELVAQSLYLFLPAYVANMAPVVARRLHLLPRLDRPLDGGRVFRGQPLLGAHKTLRGIVAGVVAAVAAAFLQRRAAAAEGFWAEISEFPYAEYSPLLWGALLGGGALLGDIGKSFIKRRFGIPPGRRWFPWDQIDLVVGALLFGRILYPFSWATIIVVLVATPLLGLLVNIGSYMLSIKEAW